MCHESIHEIKGDVWLPIESMPAVQREENGGAPHTRPAKLSKTSNSVGNGSANRDVFWVETSTRRDIHQPNGDRRKRPLVVHPTLTSKHWPGSKDLCLLTKNHKKIASAGLGLHTPRRSRCLWPSDRQKSLFPGNRVHEALVVVSMLCRRQFAGQRSWLCFLSTPEYLQSLFTGRPAKIHTQWPSVLVLQIPFSQMDFWREPTTADSFRATLLHAPATLRTCFFQESLRKRMNQRGLQIKKSSWMFQKRDMAWI